ncbi:MAG TPA: hydrogenase maturation nickel metallochaperone HypA [Candidatus Fournierella merdigallinarum]|nr:hydrogenase maturation nickel metallochaperone HypA [Candidatus Fournierella merdigallinarum]
MGKEICEDCGKVFEAGPKAFLCPSCRKRRLSNAAKARGLNRLGTNARHKNAEAEITGMTAARAANEEK